MSEINWNDQAKIKFDQMIEKVPWPMRQMATDKVAKSAKALVEKDARTTIEEKDLVDAFFEATPFAFHGPMISDMEELGIDYKKYGHPIDYMSGGNKS